MKRDQDHLDTSNQKIMNDETKAAKDQTKPEQGAAAAEGELPPGFQLAPFKKLYRYLTKNEKCILAIGTISAILTGIALPGFALLFGGVIDSVGPASSQEKIGDNIKRVSIFFFYVALALAILGFLNFGLWMMIGERIGLHLREQYLEAVLRQDVQWFDTSNPIEIPSKINQQCTMVSKGTGQKVANIIMSMSMFFTGMIVSLVIGWQLALTLIATSPLIVASTFILTNLAQKGLKDNAVAYSAAGGIAEQALQSIKTVASFTAEEREMNAYSQHLETSMKLGKKTACLTGLGLGFFWVAIFLMYSFGIYIGGVFVDEQFSTVGLYGQNYDSATVLSVFFTVIFGLFALGMAGPNIGAIIQARAAGAFIFQVIERQPTIDYSKYNERIDVDNLNPNIEFKDVKFAYPSRPDTTVLHNFNFVFQPGKTTAIVGSTGSGKSTIVQLIQRFYDPLEGMITIGGEKLSELNMHKLRKDVIAYVGQEPVLFDMTIRQNIKFGRSDATEDDIINACKASNAWEFICKMEKGLDTEVGSSGSQLSGGQKQRIAIARATIRRPKILLLDQATSALDRRSEALVQEALEKISQGVTTIVIAHRLTTVRNADTIIVLDKGVVIQEGNHDRLMSLKGFYANLVSGQINENNQDDEAEGVDPNQIHEQNQQQKQGGLDSIRGNNYLDGVEQNKQNEKPRKVTFDQLELKQQRSNRQPENSLVMKRRSSKRQQGVQMTQEQRKLLEQVKKEEEADKATIQQTLKKFQKYITPRIMMLSCKNKGQFWLGIFTSVVLGTVFPIFAIVLADATTGLAQLDHQKNTPGIQNPHGKQDVDQMAMWFLVIAVGSALFQWFVVLLFGYISENVTFIIRKETLKSLLSKHIGWYDLQEHNQPAMSSVLSSDTALLNSVASQNLSASISAVTSLITGVIIGFVYSWRLALVILVLAPLMVLGGFMEAKLQTGFGQDVDQAYKSSAVIVSETVTNYRTVSSFANEKLIQQYYHQSLMVPYKKGVKKSLCSGAIYGFSQCAQYVCYGIAFYVAGVFISEDLLSYQDMFRAVYAVMFGAFGAGQAQSFAPDIGRASLASANVYKIMDEPTKIDPLSEEGQKPKSIVGKIQFKNVWFKYPTRDQWVLKGLNLVIEPGQQVALVGQSGCGKSTCIQLLERFYDPTRGEILLDGVCIKQLNLKAYRQAISLVAQEPVLFDRTIHQNIAYGKPEASRQEVTDVARDANALQFIERDEMEGRNVEKGAADMGKGFDRRVGTKGGQLSGGQKQRVAIARAILKQPKILLLDEATSALDRESENQVQAALDRVMKNQTSVVIAHRLSTIEGVDSIKVLKEGVLVEEGKYEELMSKHGEFHIIATGDKSKA